MTGTYKKIELKLGKRSSRSLRYMYWWNTVW